MDTPGLSLAPRFLHLPRFHSCRRFTYTPKRDGVAQTVNQGLPAGVRVLSRNFGVRLYRGMSWDVRNRFRSIVSQMFSRRSPLSPLPSTLTPKQQGTSAALPACPLLYLPRLRIWRRLQMKRRSSSCTHASGLPVSQQDHKGVDAAWFFSPRLLAACGGIGNRHTQHTSGPCPNTSPVVRYSNCQRRCTCSWVTIDVGPANVPENRMRMILGAAEPFCFDASFDVFTHPCHHDRILYHRYMIRVRRKLCTREYKM